VLRQGCDRRWQVRLWRDDHGDLLPGQSGPAKAAQTRQCVLLRFAAGGRTGGAARLLSLQACGLPERRRLVERICRHIRSALGPKRLRLAKLMPGSGISPLSRCNGYSRARWASSPPAVTLNRCAFQSSKRGLRTSRHTGGNGAVTDALVDAGYSSPSRLYETARKKLGMTPRRVPSGRARRGIAVHHLSRANWAKMLLVASSAGPLWRGSF